jgi:hypothetical protein
MPGKTSKMCSSDRDSADPVVPEYLRWGRDDRLPSLTAENSSEQRDRGYSAILSQHWAIGEYVLFCKDADELLFTDNETNSQRLFGSASPSAFTKDAFHRSS